MNDISSAQTTTVSTELRTRAFTLGSKEINEQLPSESQTKNRRIQKLNQFRPTTSTYSATQPQKQIVQEKQQLQSDYVASEDFVAYANSAAFQNSGSKATLSWSHGTYTTAQVRESKFTFSLNTLSEIPNTQTYNPSRAAKTYSIIAKQGVYPKDLAVFGTGISMQI